MTIQLRWLDSQGNILDDVVDHCQHEHLSIEGAGRCFHRMVDTVELPEEEDGDGYREIFPVYMQDGEFVRYLDDDEMFLFGDAPNF